MTCYFCNYFLGIFCKDLGIQDPEVAVSSYSGLCTSAYLVSILSFYPKLKNVLFQPAIAFSIREQLYEVRFLHLLELAIELYTLCKLDFHSFCLFFSHIALSSIVASARESRISKKGRRGTDHTPTRVSGVALDLVKLFGHKSSVVRQIGELKEISTLYTAFVIFKSLQEAEEAYEKVEGSILIE
ncbi:hypothetical protein G4B88_028181, partial [Cannabis sativa]